jgi:two-component system OmpR family response regulator
MDKELRRVMLVEDEAGIRTVAGMALEMVGGYTLRACASGAEALQAVAEFKPHLVLLDVMMPDMDGPGVLGELRARPDTAAIPVIFLTAKAQPEEIEKLRALGSIEVIGKPFDPMTLAEEVKAAWLRWAAQQP